MLPTVSPSLREEQERLLFPETLQTLHGGFETFGCALVERAFPLPWIARWQAAFARQYRRFFSEDEGHLDAQRVGDKRWMITLKIQGDFATPELYAPPLLFPWIKQALGSECTLSSLGVVLSLPQARAQHDHRDLPLLFQGHPVDPLLPPYAITLLLPLLECNELHGTTCLRLASHKHLDPETPGLCEVQPTVPLGSCLLMDYRLQHFGTPNLSTQPRPLLFLVFSRPWFRDHRNFKKQPPLQITRSAFHRLPNDFRHLFAFAQLSWW